jgi:Mg-chelatase subunit ChlD
VSFVTALALLGALLVAVPYAAHRLRRRRAEDQAFPPARLVAPSPQQARKPSRLEDRALLVLRAAAVVGLALLGATPLVRCSRLSVQRSGGASVALAVVVDDSLSMRAPIAGGGATRFERARQGAAQLLASAQEGDALAVILAGAPARIALAPTTDLAAARQAIDALRPGDRGTDLDGALTLARGVVASLPQVDRRIVLLSDLADGHADGPALDDRAGTDPAAPSVWIPLPEIRGDATDCGLLRADRHGARVRLVVACGPGKSAAGREVVVEDAAGKALGRASVSHGAPAEATVLLPTDTTVPWRAQLTGGDAIAADDVAPVVAEARRGAIAVVSDPTGEAVATGGAPIVEQALASLRADVDLRPIPAPPDRAEDFSDDLGVLLDDPPGFTPEQRHALAAFLERGGVALVALGPRAAVAPLGATLDPILSQAVAWSPVGRAAQAGADVASAVGALAGAAQSLTELGADRRAVLGPDDARAFEPMVRWADGAPLVARRAVGRGEAWIVTLPFSVDASDLPLRPAFLAMLDAWVQAARQRAVPRRSDVGTAWRFAGARDVRVTGPEGDVPVARDEGVARVVPPLLGRYEIVVDGQRETRVAAPAERELDLRPRPSTPGAEAARGAGARAAVDVSGEIALGLLALMALEMALRVWSRRRDAEPLAIPRSDGA